MLRMLMNNECLSVCARLLLHDLTCNSYTLFQQELACHTQFLESLSIYGLTNHSLLFRDGGVSDDKVGEASDSPKSVVAHKPRNRRVSSGVDDRGEESVMSVEAEVASEGSASGDDAGGEECSVSEDDGGGEEEHSMDASGVAHSNDGTVDDCEDSSVGGNEQSDDFVAYEPSHSLSPPPHDPAEDGIENCSIEIVSDDDESSQTPNHDTKKGVGVADDAGAGDRGAAAGATKATPGTRKPRLIILSDDSDDDVVPSEVAPRSPPVSQPHEISPPRDGTAVGRFSTPPRFQSAASPASVRSEEGDDAMDESEVSRGDISAHNNDEFVHVGEDANKDELRDLPCTMPMSPHAEGVGQEVATPYALPTDVKMITADIATSSPLRPAEESRSETSPSPCVDGARGMAAEAMPIADEGDDSDYYDSSYYDAESDSGDDAAASSHDQATPARPMVINGEHYASPIAYVTFYLLNAFSHEHVCTMLARCVKISSHVYSNCHGCDA